jgi:hypothetical protein
MLVRLSTSGYNKFWLSDISNNWINKTQVGKVNAITADMLVTETNKGTNHYYFGAHTLVRENRIFSSKFSFSVWVCYVTISITISLIMLLQEQQITELHTGKKCKTQTYTVTYDTLLIKTGKT